MLSAVDRAMILTAPYCRVCLCRTALTREQPPLPIVLPSCQCPMYVFRLRPEAVVEAVEIAELRLESRSLSPAIWEIRLCSGELVCPSRTVSEPLAMRDSLCGKAMGEVAGCLVCLKGRRVRGEEFAPLASTLRGCRFCAARLLRYRSAIGDWVQGGRINSHASGS